MYESGDVGATSLENGRISSPEWLNGIEFVVGQYREALRKHGASQSALMWPKGRQIERFVSLTKHIAEEPFSILDFGCGLGDLYSFLDQKYRQFDYLGLDIVQEFVDEARSRYPDTRFECANRIDSGARVLFDHVVICGTFNLWPSSLPSSSQLVYEQLAKLFMLATKTLSVNFMTTNVDFVQDNAVHFDPVQMRTFCRESLSHRVVLDESYLPYEFTITVMR